ncbi:MAG: DinB family protein [Deltaproteobacteria bacterium]|nr:DinB family protein [Deltaproteobacteria bacterium]
MQLISHIVAAERIWLDRLVGARSETTVWPDLTMQECLARIHANADSYGQFFSTLTPEKLSSKVRYTNQRGDTFEDGVSNILLHVLSHGAYHRGQIASSIKRSGGVPAQTDYIFFTRGRGL